MTGKNTNTSRPTVFLVGPRAAGKTTVGRRLASELGANFVDTDECLAEKQGRPVAEIVAEEGWEAFRGYESEMLQEVSAPGLVVATGGGMVLAEANRDFMRERGLVFYLSAPAETLAARLAADPKSGQRPSLTGRPAIEEVAQVLAEREALYRQAAHLVADAALDLEELIADMLVKIAQTDRLRQVLADDSEREISFLTARQPEPLPPKGILGAMGFLNLPPSVPSPGRPCPPLFRGMTGLLCGSDWVLAEPVLGAPMAVMALEEMARRGVREFIFLGLAGSLNPNLRVGDLWCPQSVLSTEGSSAHYPAPLEPDPELHGRLLELAARDGGPVINGRHWSTDGFYRETAGLVNRQREAGALGVDMECAALWAAARFRGLKLASLMVISDLLCDGRHHLGFDRPEFAEGLRRAAGLAWRALGFEPGGGV